MGRKAALLESLLAAAMVVVAVSLVLVPLLGPGGVGLGRGPVFGRLLSVPAQLSAPVPGLAGLAGGTFDDGEAVELSGPAVVTATVYSPSPTQRLGLVGGRVVAGLTALWVLWLLLHITRSLRRGEVFATENARRLSGIAVLVGVGATASQLLTAFGTVRVLDAATVRGSVTPTFELSFLPLVAALGIAVLAEVFRQGAALRDEVEGLV